ncbi:SLC16A5 [Bugula neritina]|uniref:SLC16A5 n=1 Tax=Bugula neritina TaxID=10212 RepID=A0A7J7JWZ8_BUGNE|nr:SLC16A5 [Bugula neritina]
MVCYLSSEPKLQKDKGYAWLIMVLSFLSHFVSIGFTFGVIGNLTTIHSQFFNIGLQQSSLIGNIHTTTVFLFAPVASILVKKAGCRMTQIFGGICLILGLSLLSLATKQWHAICLFGILAGMGVSTTYVASSSILSVHFLKYQYFAFSFASLGSFIGNSVWPMLCQYLFDTMGYSRAVAYFSIFHILHVIAGLSFCEVSQSESEPIDEKISEAEGGVDAAGDKKLELSIIDGGYSNHAFKNTGEDAEENKKEETDSEDASPATVQQTDASSSVSKSLLALARLPKVWMLLVNFLLWNSCSNTFHILINDYLMKYTDLADTDVTWAVVVLGIAKIVGSLLVVALSSLQFDRLNLHFFTVILYSVMTVVVPYCTGKESCYAVIAVFGMSFAMSISNLLAVVTEFCHVDLIPLLFGLLLLSESVGGLAGTSLYTLLAVKTEEQYGLVLAGCAGVLGSLLLLPEMIRRVRGSEK